MVDWMETVSRRQYVREHRRAGRNGILAGLFYLALVPVWVGEAFVATLDHGRVDFAGPTMGPYAWAGFVVGVVLAVVLFKAGVESIGVGLDHRQSARDAQEETRGRWWLIFLALVPPLATAFSPEVRANVKMAAALLQTFLGI